MADAKRILIQPIYPKTWWASHTKIFCPFRRNLNSLLSFVRRQNRYFAEWRSVRCLFDGEANKLPHPKTMRSCIERTSDVQKLIYNFDDKLLLCVIVQQALMCSLHHSVADTTNAFDTWRQRLMADCQYIVYATVLENLHLSLMCQSVDKHWNELTLCLTHHIHISISWWNCKQKPTR